MTTDTLGGVWTYAIELSRGLAREDVEVVLATMGAPLTDVQRREVRALTNVIVQESGYQLEWMDHPWSDVSAAGFWLLDLERRFHPDVIHLNQFAHGAQAWKAPCLIVGHSCVISWWKAVRGDEVPACWRRYRQAVGRGLRAADRVVAPSQAMQLELEEHYGPLRQSSVIPNGRALLIPRLPKEPFVLTAGRLWDEAKNVRALAEVARELPWPVYVAGQQRHPGGRMASLPDGVRLLGQLPPEQLAEWYARASIYVLPARYEPFGFTPLEAAAGGCALVLGDIPSLREVWADAALFVRPGDNHSLRVTLTDLMADPIRLQEFSKRAERRQCEYAPARMAMAYLSVYTDLITRKKVSPIGRSRSIA